jgi:hypothetical protein
VVASLKSASSRRQFKPAVLVGLVVSVALAAGLGATGADARAVKSGVNANIEGIIERNGTITYTFSGNIGAQGLSFGCMEGRRVVLFRVEKGGTRRRVMSAESRFFGVFSERLELRLGAISGHYFARVEPRIRKTKRGRLRCLSARSKAFLVQVPDELTKP